MSNMVKKKKQQPATKYDEYKQMFKSEDDRINHSITTIIAVVIAVYFCFHMDQFIAFFYVPGRSWWMNGLSFICFLVVCWFFGLYSSRIIGWSRKKGEQIAKHIFRK